MRRIYSFFKQNILAGIIVTVPFGLTFFILYKLGAWIVSLLSAAPARLIGGYLAELPGGLYEAALFLIGLTGTLLVVLFIGAVARNFVGKKLVDFGETIISKIPLTRTIYVATKQVINTLFVGTGIKNLKRVALLEFPRKGVYSIGFITGSLEPGTHQNQSAKKLLSVFVPTTPNPTTGYYVMVPEEEVTELPIAIEEAFKIIMSGGLATNNIEHALPGKKND
ncbi:MAG TPA: DUF502 domain-containing protein [Thermodesulfobacteriota bacterium]|nr:DUF502 domain-containing protein [Thermodesulfobacteriota bacterium]